jgi:hypothetical protein
MARKRLDGAGDSRGMATGTVTWRNIEQDLLVNAVLSVAAGLVALGIMPPSGAEWSLATQATVAAVIALIVFGVATPLTVVPEFL